MSIKGQVFTWVWIVLEDQFLTFVVGLLFHFVLVSLKNKLNVIHK